MRKWPEQVSRNFKLDDFRCPCCHDVDLNPFLVLALQWLRDRTGKPIVVMSGYRCPEHNNAIGVGASAESQHLFGKAVDIQCSGETPEDLAKFAEHIPYFRTGGIGIYDHHVHVDVREGAARWDNRTERPQI